MLVKCSIVIGLVTTVGEEIILTVCDETYKNPVTNSGSQVKVSTIFLGSDYLPTINDLILLVDPIYNTEAKKFSVGPYQVVLLGKIRPKTSNLKYTDFSPEMLADPSIPPYRIAPMLR